jgi:general secretion pathway protein G
MSSHRTKRARSIVRRGFSLIEVIVAVTIIAIFAGLIGPKLLKNIGGGKTKKAQADTKTIDTQVKLYLTDRQSTKVGTDFQLDMLVPEYIESADELTDPWGNRYRFEDGTDGRDFDIVSYGRDGQPGGAGEDADIRSGKLAKGSE